MKLIVYRFGVEIKNYLFPVLLKKPLVTGEEERFANVVEGIMRKINLILY